ncbi:transglycosylase domain-containing protein [Evansella clarkii]|uniref:transglycosylase domain-containing protein n=1 Tax=Evansella clarkii TaxID=79879 RepID=UPI000997C9A6|nr:PBP1A family penicillin-binding protein [Evansella clarkii]
MEVLTRRAYKKRKRAIQKVIRSAVILMTLTLGSLAAIVAYAYQLEPPALSVPETTVMFSGDGAVIGEIHQGENRHWIPLDHMGRNILEATIAVEDKRFYNHYGFDLFRIGGAVLANLKSGTKAQGASTITQQYARNLYLTHEKTWARKWNEAFYALRLELHYPKKDILEGYLNTIYYGNGAYGIEAASNIYFEKNAEDLSLAEAAMLAGIPKGPNLYSPLINEQQAEFRQEIVLSSMKEAGYITEEQKEQASKERLKYASDTDLQANRIAPYFQDSVISWLEDKLGLDNALLTSGGLEIHTTLDVGMQKKAEKWLENELKDSGELQAAFIAMDPRTGEVKSLIGGKNYQDSSFNRALQAKRHPGSTIKPFLYYAALEHGMRPNSMLKSEETTFLYDNSRKEYTPGNFNGRYADDYITMLQALAVSDNIYAMKTHFLLGFDVLAETASRFGIESPLNPVPALALGASDVGILEMTGSYSPFANGGYLVEPQFVTKVLDRDGNVIFEAEEEKDLALDPALTAIMTNMMQGMFEPSLGASFAGVTGGSVSHFLDRPTAGKSGSTSTDSWMIGYTPQLLSGVWVGYDQNESLSDRDAGYAKKIWAKFMQDALQEEMKLAFPVPDTLVEAEINPFNGKLATEACPVRRKTYFFAGTEPEVYCTEHLEHNTDLAEPDKDTPDEEDGEKDKWMERIIKWFN